MKMCFVAGNENHLLPMRVCISNLIVDIWPFMREVGHNNPCYLNATKNLLGNLTRELNVVNTLRSHANISTRPLDSFVGIFECGIVVSHCHEHEGIVQI